MIIKIIEIHQEKYSANTYNMLDTPNKQNNIQNNQNQFNQNVDFNKN